VGTRGLGKVQGQGPRLTVMSRRGAGRRVDRTDLTLQVVDVCAPLKKAGKQKTCRTPVAGSARFHSGAPGLGAGSLHGSVTIVRESLYASPPWFALGVPCVGRVKRPARFTTVYAIQAPPSVGSVSVLESPSPPGIPAPRRLMSASVFAQSAKHSAGVSSRSGLRSLPALFSVRRLHRDLNSNRSFLCLIQKLRLPNRLPDGT
jgi:hypothetical protein